MLIDLFQRVSYKTTVEHNSLLKIICINIKLGVRMYETEAPCIPVKNMQSSF